MVLLKSPGRVLLCGTALAVVLVAGPTGQRGQRPATPPHQTSPSLDSAQWHYYSGRYELAAAEALAVRQGSPDDLAAYEVRTAALLFQVKRLIGEPEDRKKALAACAACPDLIETFTDDITDGRERAKARLKADPDDAEALFFLGKLDLNYIWLHLGPLGRRTGWSEYREARRSLDTLLKADPTHVRARVARAWIDYIVDTRVMFMFRWVLGGGDRSGALRVVRETASAEAPFFTTVEAKFALWEMLARERQFAEAAAVARGLLRDFPDNRELVRFVQEHDSGTPAPAAGR